MLPEVTDVHGSTHIEDIYLVASFNNWIPARMEAWEKKLVLLKDKHEIESETDRIRDQLKQLHLPQATLKDHIKRKYAHLTRNESQEQLPSTH